MHKNCYYLLPHDESFIHAGGQEPPIRHPPDGADPVLVAHQDALHLDAGKVQPSRCDKTHRDGRHVLTHGQTDTTKDGHKIKDVN